MATSTSIFIIDIYNTLSSIFKMLHINKKISTSLLNQNVAGRRGCGWRREEGEGGATEGGRRKEDGGGRRSEGPGVRKREGAHGVDKVGIAAARVLLLFSSFSSSSSSPSSSSSSTILDP
jgi:hypothetical protein